MRKVVISLAAAASALVLAAPASAQWAPAYPQAGYGYNTPAYGYGYGYGGNVRALQYRVDALQRQIRVMDDRNVISRREARRLRDESRSLERHLRRAASYGLNPYEARDVEIRIARLEQHIQREAWDRDGRWGRNRDRDRDHDWRDRRDDDRYRDRDRD